jgi:hypothetical protein
MKAASAISAENKHVAKMAPSRRKAKGINKQPAWRATPGKQAVKRRYAKMKSEVSALVAANGVKMAMKMKASMLWRKISQYIMKISGVSKINNQQHLA